MAACVKPGESMAQLDGNDKTSLKKKWQELKAIPFFI